MVMGWDYGLMVLWLGLGFWFRLVGWGMGWIKVSMLVFGLFFVLACGDFEISSACFSTACFSTRSGPGLMLMGWLEGVDI